MKGQKIIVFLLICVAFAGLLINARQVSAEVAEALRLCATALIPSLLPFMVLSRVLISLLPSASFPWLNSFMRRCFGLSGNCFFPLLVSFLGGYPVGISSAVSLFQRHGISREDCEKLLPVCNNSGPGFFVGFLGGAVFESVAIGLLLYGVHVFSALLCLILFRKPVGNFILRHPSQGSTQPLPTLFLSAISESCGAMLQISALVLLFSVFSVFLKKLPLEGLTQAIILGSAELTGGCLQLKGLAGAIPAAAFLMGWGGFCVHMQAAGLWLSAGLKGNNYFLSKLLHGTFSAFFSTIFLAPTSYGLAAGCSIIIFCLIFPLIRKKYGGNLQRYAV